MTGVHTSPKPLVDLRSEPELDVVVPWGCEFPTSIKGRFEGVMICDMAECGGLPNTRLTSPTQPSNSTAGLI